MRGEVAHHLVTAANRVVPAWTVGRLYELPEGYPALVEAEDGRVEGELCFFDAMDALWPVLDAYEGVDPDDPEGSLYLRVERQVEVIGAGERLAAWCYVVPRSREAALVARGARRWPGARWRPRESLGSK